MLVDFWQCRAFEIHGSAYQAGGIDGRMCSLNAPEHSSHHLRWDDDVMIPSGMRSRSICKAKPIHRKGLWCVCGDQASEAICLKAPCDGSIGSLLPPSREVENIEAAHWLHGFFDGATSSPHQHYRAVRQIRHQYILHMHDSFYSAF